MTDKLSLREAVIVEGRYDKIKLSEFIASPIIETGGFRVFKDKEKQSLIRQIAERRGILVMTDVDSAGFVIRNFLRGIVPEDHIKHCYIPVIEGKERRKSEPSKEGRLGVEGIGRDELIRAIRLSGAEIIGEDNPAGSEMTKLDLYELGLTGRPDSALLRARVLSDLGLPEYLSTNAMLAAMNCLFSPDEFREYMKKYND